MKEKNSGTPGQSNNLSKLADIVAVGAQTVHRLPIWLGITRLTRMVLCEPGLHNSRV